MKYRVWNYKTGSYDEEIIVTQDGGMIHTTDRAFNPNEAVIEEFTKTKDKHGEDVYVGDWLEISGFEDGDWNPIPTMIGIIEESKTNHPMGRFVFVYDFPNEPDKKGEMSMIGMNILAHKIGDRHNMIVVNNKIVRGV